MVVVVLAAAEMAASALLAAASALLAAARGPCLLQSTSLDWDQVVGPQSESEEGRLSMPDRHHQSRARRCSSLSCHVAAQKQRRLSALSPALATLLIAQVPYACWKFELLRHWVGDWQRA